jgi:hypothetical protein
MRASSQGRGAEEAGALAHELASLAFRHVFVLPIGNALDGKASQSRVKQAQLMIVDRGPNSCSRECGRGLAKLSLIVHRINPQLLEIRACETHELQAHQGRGQQIADCEL